MGFHCTIALVMASATSIVAAVRTFVDTEVRPAAAELEHVDAYPHRLVGRMRELGLFGALVPSEYGGLGLDVSTYARVVEELCRGFMSLAGVVNSHTMAALIVLHHGTDEQKRRFLPRFAGGEARGGLCLTEPHAGSDVQAILTVARRLGADYRISGTKMFVTNGREGNTFALLAVTDPKAQPRHRGMSCFIVEKGHDGLRVVKSIGKLGYKGVDTAELLFEDYHCPAANLVGGVEGRGFGQVMSGLEAGRINIAARAVGVAQAAYDDARAASARAATTAPALADMAAGVAAARLLTYWAAGMKDRRERCDLEAGMAKLYASETAHEVATMALRVAGSAGLRTDRNLERYYRDTPLMIIGEGTNEIQRTIIARNLVDRYGERLGALTSRDGENDHTREMVLAVRLFAEKEIAPVAHELDADPERLAAAARSLGDLGVLGALISPDLGGLGLDARLVMLLIEELARASGALGALLTGHVACTAAFETATAEQRRRWLPALGRGERLAALVDEPAVSAVSESGALRLRGAATAAATAGINVFLVDVGGGALAVLGRADVAVGEPLATLGLRGLAPSTLVLDGVRLDATAVITGPAASAHARRVATLGVAATAVGIAQAAFEAALRYSQQRSTFGKPIAQHQAVQLKLADMATAITAARLLTYDSAGTGDGVRAGLAKVLATETACDVTLESMRIHGGYGYTTEFPVERYYRDAAHLPAALGGNDRERAAAAQALAASSPTGG
jgi:alkylation response protein AidB-like acyl-CoA dehydrogenase